MPIGTPTIKYLNLVFVTFISMGIFACSDQVEQTQKVLSSPATQAAVAMPDSYSADVARDILQKGGNAVDAAIAAQFVLAVTLPEAGNIGGGGFMLVYKDIKSIFVFYVSGYLIYRSHVKWHSM